MANIERAESGRIEGVLPPIPAKRYFTIGEVSELCLVKPYVLRYWEQEFTQLRPMKRRGNRRYYQHHEVLLIRRIRELLYERGFTISGARNELAAQGLSAPSHHDIPEGMDEGIESTAELETASVSVRPQGPVVTPVQRVRTPARQGAWGAVSAQPLLASAASASVGSPAPLPDLSALHQASPEAVAALRASLLSIRDLLS
jgi:DNA-binding transcriptional MerR regulator